VNTGIDVRHRASKPRNLLRFLIFKKILLSAFTQGGLIGGRARADALSKARRSEIAKKAAEARWAKNKQSEAQPAKD